jgi:hypothetical protein
MGHEALKTSQEQEKIDMYKQPVAATRKSGQKICKQKQRNSTRA